MTCKDCIHSEVCYKKNDYENFPDRCGEFISDKVLEERPQGEWINIGFMVCKCNKCGQQFHELEENNYCPNCGADMRGDRE